MVVDRVVLLSCVVGSLSMMCVVGRWCCLLLVLLLSSCGDLVVVCN